MSHAGSDSDSLLDLLNDSLEKNDIGSAGDSDYIEKSDHDTSSDFSGTFLSESQTEELGPSGPHATTNGQIMHVTIQGLK
ncbi:hypothetical protein T03_1237 [Trichinella britovi]|uniref:Uncharacterized protein n=1 Tax=Trichinella britovi TaxID=45882 RepID=A0A0V1CIP5_TRIBR|nr:hypothetical protein T03_1237 [Trichinella britovi]